MAVNVIKEDNILKIDDGVKVKYFNAAWCTIDFTANSVIITDEGRGDGNNVASILFTDFQYNAVAKSTESDIYDSLKANIG